MKKKIGTLIAAALLLCAFLLVFAGCGGSEIKGTYVLESVNYYNVNFTNLESQLSQIDMEKISVTIEKDKITFQGKLGEIASGESIQLITDYGYQKAGTVTFENNGGRENVKNVLIDGEKTHYTVMKTNGSFASLVMEETTQMFRKVLTFKKI